MMTNEEILAILRQYPDLVPEVLAILTEAPAKPKQICRLSADSLRLCPGAQQRFHRVALLSNSTISCICLSSSPIPAGSFFVLIGSSTVMPK